MAIIDRVERRIGQFDDRERLEELINTVCDRLLLRAGVAAFKDGERVEFPALLESIAVEAVCKAYNQLGYEGIASESVDTINTAFISSILDEYATEIAAFVELQITDGAGVVRFI